MGCQISLFEMWQYFNKTLKQNPFLKRLCSERAIVLGQGPFKVIRDCPNNVIFSPTISSSNQRTAKEKGKREMLAMRDRLKHNVAHDVCYIQQRRDLLWSE